MIAANNARPSIQKILFLALVVPVASVAPAQTPGATDREPSFHATDISLSVSGNFAQTRDPQEISGSGIYVTTTTHSVGETPSPNVLLGVHHQFNHLLGYRFDLGYTRTTFNYVYQSANYAGSFFYAGSIRSDIYEGSASYVIRGPRNKRLSTFASGGCAMLTFVPTDRSQPDSYVFRPAGVGALAADFHLNRSFDLRSQYRGLFFQSPDFRYMGNSVPVIARHEYTSQIVVGFAYTFRSRQ